ncbi:TonB-dependent siderophore receptor [Thauera linaloolentis]|uniref:TonB-dependent siderophore receptor n=1 Tax=Thauera linaloolentis (strain DSM 12138 / JCM 21573 / CCUG 41526 / CIP 105981 / IAM 15112 / NBRC 102519 / 47Lol) TaxID=1123367 RepID=N6Z9C9_THAL4|nr:TonB-dependent receptor [Thauera linaloolentis]ENO88759.1 TonB-dependent siderophore receptor [Thauera linaloolentis 47Lol = DSM 12138]MCM8564932.1 TonB-dependent receptor [Thauera linaloolentis]
MPQRNKPRSRLLPIAAALCGAFALLAGPPAPAHAQTGAQQAERSVDIDLPAQPLGSALNELSRQTGAQIFADGALLSGRPAPAVSGRMSIEQALSRMLAGSGLRAQASGSNGFTIAPSPEAPAPEALLPAVTISGKASGATTEGTGSYITWSTSSSTRLNLTPQETPQAVTVMTRQRMDDQKLDTLVDVLDATPGIYVAQGSIGQDAPNMYARGASLSNFQIDGVPTFSGMSPFLASTAAYDRVEVVRGATGVMNGLGTPAATVNLIRKRPTAERQFSLTTQAGNWDRYGVGADASGAVNESGTARLRLVGDYKDEGAWVDRFHQKKLALYGIGEFDLSEKTLLTLGFNHLRQDTDSAIVGRPLYFSDGQRIPLSPSDNTSQKWRYYKHDMDGIFASLEHRFSSGWVGKVEYSHTRYEYDGLIASMLGSIDPATGAGMTIRPNRWDSELRQNNVDAYVSGVFPLFGRDHELIAGLTLSRLESDGSAYTLDAGYPTATTLQDWANAPAPTFANTGGNKSEERNYGAFVNTRFSLTDSTSLLLGGRTTRWTRDIDVTSLLWGDYSLRERRNTFVPYAGIVHALNDTWSVYASYTKIFRPQDDWLNDYFTASQLQPEEGVSYEAGVKASFAGGRLTGSLSVFRSEVDNLAVWNADAFTYDLLGNTRARGIELELNGELTPDWQLSAGYAFAVSKDGNGERVLTYVPRQTLKLFTSYRLPGEWNKLTVGGGVNWQNANNSGSGFDHRQGSLALVSLMGRYQIDRNLSVSLNLNNALDKRYLSSNGDYGTYGAPRNFMASLKYSF